MNKLRNLRKLLGYVFFGAVIATILGIIFFACTLGRQIDVFIAKDNYNYVKDNAQYKWQANEEYNTYINLNDEYKENGNFVSKWFFNQSSAVKYGLDFFFFMQPFVAFYALYKNAELREEQKKLAKNKARKSLQTKKVMA